VILHGKLDSSDWTFNCHSPSHPVPRYQDYRLLFSNTWFIMAKSLLIIFQLPSCLTNHFMTFIDSFLKIFFLWSSYFHRYLILRNITWLILSWLWASHKYWIKLIFIFFMFICFSCLVWNRFFNMKLFIDWLYMLIT
jgi:hypothetical protein